MPYNPSEPIDIKVELNITGFGWVTVSSPTRRASAIRIKASRSEGAIQGETSWCAITLGNNDGWLTEENPLSPWWPYIGRGTPLRVSLAGILPAAAEVFDGEIDDLVLEFPGPGLCNAAIEAVGTLGAVAQSDDPLRSALFRSLSGVAPGVYVPHAYWPMEDPVASARIASGLPTGAAAVMSGTVTLAADAALAGSAALPLVAAGAQIVMVVPTYADTGKWVRQFAMKIPAAPSVLTTYAEVKITDGFVATLRLELDPTVSPKQVNLLAYNALGVLLGGSGTFLDGLSPGRPSEAVFFNRWIFWTIGLEQFAGKVTNALGYSSGSDGLIKQPTTGALLAPGATGRPSELRSYGAGPSGTYFGHDTLYVDASINVVGSADNHDLALDGYTGEQAHVRFARLGHEEDIAVVVVGDVSARMGPQRIAALPELWRDCEAADQGLMSDVGAGGAMVYRTRRALCDQNPVLSVVRGSLMPGTQPRFDRQRVHNDVTVTRRGGSSARASDEVHIARTRRRMRATPTVDLESDEVLADHASFGTTVGTAVGPRYSQMGINLRNNDAALLADQVLAVTPGDRFVCAGAALPSQHPPGGFDQMIIGWETFLDRYQWEFWPVCVPYAPYRDLGRWDTMGSVLHSALTSTATTADVATTGGPPWTTVVGTGLDWEIGGEQIRVTAIAASTVTFGATGSVSHANNASVTPGLPAGLAAGNLMVMLAAIRNSGAGVPNTPGGWHRFPVFPTTSNVQMFGRIAGSSESGPTVTFTGGVAGADTSAQIISLAGKWHDVQRVLIGSAACLNPSAQNIIYPGLSKPDDALDHILLYVGWKQDDWTSVDLIAGTTEIGEPDTITGDDQGIVWAYDIQAPGATAAVAAGAFVVIGGVNAISRGAVVALRPDYQTATITRSVNGVVKSHSAGASVALWQPMRWAL